MFRGNTSGQSVCLAGMINPITLFEVRKRDQQVVSGIELKNSLHVNVDSQNTSVFMGSRCQNFSALPPSTASRT
jgi:hypothetical protein